VYEATKVKSTAHTVAPKAPISKSVPVLATTLHSSKVELPESDEAEEKQQVEAEKKEADENPLEPEVIHPAPRVMAKSSSHVERPEPTPTEQAEHN